MNRPWIRLAFAAFFLMAQVMSAAIPVRADAKPVCQMKCCAPGAASCCCAEPVEAPAPTAPVNSPPETGHELATVTWLIFTPVFPWATFKAEPIAGSDMHSVATQRHVRLTVLFRSILI